VFDALMDERSVTRAAERLALTQPAVSASLQRLRESFGDALFVRSQRGINPTLRALALAAPIKRILAEAAQLLQPERFEPAQAQFTLSLAATDYALRAVVLPFITALRLKAPGIRVAVQTVDDSHMLARMESGTLDMALLTPQSAPPQLHCKSLFEESYVCVLRADHPLALAGELSLEQFCALAHGVVSLQGGGFQGPTDEALARIGRQRRVMLSVPSFVMLLDAVRSSDLAALVPRRLLQGAQGLCLIAPPLEVAGFRKILVWHARTHDDPGYRWLRELLFTTCADALPPPNH
jgi:DNA-binding transcriptional LysR family regulator